jgi:hypothetical protein
MPRKPPRRHTLDPSDAPETTVQSLAVLSSYRECGVRDSSDVVKRGETILSKKGALQRMGEEGVSILR